MEQGTPKLRFAMLGAGFWASFQLAGWLELGNVECVAICNRTRSKAEDLAHRFQIPSVYDDPSTVFAKEDLDFVDVVTAVETHPYMVSLAAANKTAVICQKPMAPTLAEAAAMVAQCAKSDVPLLINENWRWQTPIRAMKSILESAEIGEPFRARIDLISGFPVFENQPFLKTLDRFILTDLGSHLLDAARFLFGEADSLYCHTGRIHTDIAGEDVATVLMRMRSGMSVLVEMAYAGNYIESDHFPETHIFVEGSLGSIELKPGYNLDITTRQGTRRQRVCPPRFAWADPRYDVVHSSIVPCQASLASALLGTGEAETTGTDNLLTARLVFAAYESVRTGAAIQVGDAC